MDKNEVIYRLTEHLKAKERKRGTLCSADKFYCITYVMDFMLLSKEQAKQFLKENIPEFAQLLTDKSKKTAKSTII